MTVPYFPILLTNKSIEKIVQCNKFLNQYLQPAKLLQKGCFYTRNAAKGCVGCRMEIIIKSSLIPVSAICKTIKLGILLENKNHHIAKNGPYFLSVSSYL